MIQNNVTNWNNETVPVGTQRESIRVKNWTQIGFQWIQNAGSGVATSITFYVTCVDYKIASQELDPALNPVWQVQPELTFATLPVGTTPEAALPITACGLPWTGIMVEIEVTTELEQFSLSFVGKNC